jgi:hypothetical protein
MYYSSDAGQNWTKSTSTAANKEGFVNCAMFGQYAVATTFYYGGYQGIIYSSDYGVIWSDSVISPAQTYYFDGGICINNTVAYALIGSPLGYVYSKNNGATWTFVSSSSSLGHEISISGNQLFSTTYNTLLRGRTPF